MRSLWRNVVGFGAVVGLLAGASLAESPKPPAHSTAEAKAKIGQAAPDFELTGADGKTYKLADYKDKVVVLEWCSKDCPFSHKESPNYALPKMQELSKAYGEKGVVWLGIDSTNWTEAKERAEFDKEKGIAYPILMDNDGKVGHLYGATNTPHMFIINKGTLVYMGAHDDKGDRSYIRESLDALLAGKEVPQAETKPYGCTVKYAGSKAPKKGGDRG